MQGKAASGITRGLDVFYSFFFVLTTAFIASVVLLTYDFDAQKLVGNGLIPNLVFTAIDVSVALLLLCLLARRREEPLPVGGGLRLWVVVLISAALLCIQAFIAYHIYYMQEHDALIVFETAYCNAMGYPQYRNTEYFNTWPNNLFLLAIETLLLSIPKALFGMEPSRERCVLLLVLVQCVLNTASGGVTALLTQKLAGSMGLSGKQAGRAAIGAWGMWLVLVGLSPWFTVVYSDSMTILFPVLLIWLYANRKSGIHAVVTYLLIGLLGGLAFKIKPQSSLMLIAVVMVDGAALAVRSGWRKQIVLRLAAMLVAVAVVLGPGMKLASRISDIEVDPEKAFGMTHYLALGLNTDTHGIFSPYDLDLSLEAGTKAERVQVNLRTAMSRLKKMGPGGLAVHMRNKMMINFADGSFYWSDFPIHEVPERSGLSRVLRDIFYYYGEYQPVLHTVEQGVWVFVLLLCPFAVLALGMARRRGREQEADVLRVMMLTAAGAMTFNMIFEARGRYIFSNVPVLIVLTVLAFAALVQRCREKRPVTALEEGGDG